VDDNDTVRRVKEILVYAPVGFAMYLRDTAPSFLKVFVARGRAEFDQKKKSVGDQIGQVRDTGVSATGDNGTQVLRLVTDGLSRVKETAEGALAVIGTFGADDGGESPTRASRPTNGSETSGTPAGGSGATITATAPPPDLAIPDYDALSASQVVEHLGGLRVDELEAIRAYEMANRSRATILGKIEQLTRPG
jgi:hypothetical protein